jgi:hypothetical protein
LRYDLAAQTGKRNKSLRRPRSRAAALFLERHDFRLRGSSWRSPFQHPPPGGWYVDGAGIAVGSCTWPTKSTAPVASTTENKNGRFTIMVTGGGGAPDVAVEEASTARTTFLAAGD